MLDLIKKLCDILTPQERRNAVVLILLMLVTGLVEMTGIASVAPFLAVIANQDVIHTNTLLSFVYEQLGFKEDNTFLIFLGSCVFAIVVIGLSLNSLTQYFTVKYTFMRGFSLSSRLMKTYLSRPYPWFLNHHSSDLGKSILSEVDQVLNSVLMPFLQLLTRLSLVICLTFLLFYINPFITLAVITGFGLFYTLIFWRMKQYLTSIGQKRVKVNRRRFQASQEAFVGIKEVKASGLEAAFLKKFSQPALLFARYQANSRLLAVMPRYIVEAISFGGIILILLFLLFSYQGDLSKVLPIMGVFAFAGQRLLPAIQAIYQSATTIKYGFPALDSLHHDIIEVSDQDGPDVFSKTFIDHSPIGLKNNFELKGVEYGYPNTQALAVKNLSLKIPVNSTIGIVGSTGAGKTTLVDIFLGLLPPQKGELLVDDKKIDQSNIIKWQRTLGYVPQQIFLADDTVKANIAFGVSEDLIDHDAVLLAAKIAELHDFIMKDLSKGYDTFVGESGVRLSGGQRQRIDIARALYHNPDVLIMDEATSALDSQAERVVQKALENLMKGRTSFVIAHRLSTIDYASRIILLKNGTIKEQGTHDELMAQKGEYFKLQNMQATKGNN